MTTLAITPNWKNKTAKFKGTVAAGEHVSVTIQNDNGEGGEFVEDVSTLRLRVVDPCNGRTLAIFPEPVPEGETPETWDADLSPLRCTLNLNTVQMLKAIPPAANVPLLWVLDDYDNKTLYFKEQFEVTHWPRLRGEEEPTDLDNYKDIIADFNMRLTAAEQTVATAATNAQSAAASASAAAASASTAATAATDAQTGAIASKNAAQTAANDAASAKTAAETAQGKAEGAQEAAETAQGKAQEYAEAAAESAAAFVVDDTLSVEGAAADAKAVGDANQDLITRIETVQDNLDAEVTARGTLAAAVGDNRQNLAAEIARANGAEQTLEANKADKATTYTKAEVDTKIAGVQTFQKYLVNELPDPDEADMKGLYLVPTGETSEEGDLCEEWTVVEENGEKRWEKIGGTTVDLSNYYDKNAVNNLMTGKQDALTFDNAPTAGSDNPVKSGGIRAAIWGTASTAFSSLYDWVVDQLAGKQPSLAVGRIAVYGGIKTVFAEVKEQGLGVPLELPTGNTTVNGKALSSDVTLTGADIAVSGSDATKIDAALETKADKSDATLTERTVLGWVVEPETYNGVKIEIREDVYEGVFYGWQPFCGDTFIGATKGSEDASVVEWFKDDLEADIDIVATRTTITLPGYQLGSQTDKPLASEEEAEALRTGKADVSAIPYSLADPTVIDAASPEVVEGETVNYGAATLADRTANIVQVTAATALDELRIAFPAATSGKVRDFGLRVEIGTGSAVLTAPALVPIAPTGETIKIENADGAIPALADGTATAKGVTLLYFSETAPGVFVVKGEQVEEVA